MLRVQGESPVLGGSYPVPGGNVWRAEDMGTTISVYFHHWSLGGFHYDFVCMSLFMGSFAIATSLFETNSSPQGRLL